MCVGTVRAEEELWEGRRPWGQRETSWEGDSPPLAASNFRAAGVGGVLVAGGNSGATPASGHFQEAGWACGGEAVVGV